ncbi:hypothetical protein ACJX0J_012156 [Zea mays]
MEVFDAYSEELSILLMQLLNSNHKASNAETASECFALINTRKQKTDNRALGTPDADYELAGKKIFNCVRDRHSAMLSDSLQLYHHNNLETFDIESSKHVGELSRVQEIPQVSKDVHHVFTCDLLRFLLDLIALILYSDVNTCWWFYPHGLSHIEMQSCLHPLHFLFVSLMGSGLNEVNSPATTFTIGFPKSFVVYGMKIKLIQSNVSIVYNKPYSCFICLVAVSMHFSISRLVVISAATQDNQYSAFN